MNWYRTRLEKEEVAAGAVNRCQGAFAKAFAAAGGPREMALFKIQREDGGADLFLTPDCRRFAGELLQSWKSVPAERPPMAGLELLVGHNEITYYLP